MKQNEIQPVSDAWAGHQITKKQWAVVTTVAAAAAGAGPIAAAGAAIGMLGGCYVSNRMGWLDN